MSKASDEVLELVSQPPSPQQVRERQEAERPRTGLIGTLSGEWTDPTMAAQAVMAAAPKTID